MEKIKSIELSHYIINYVTDSQDIKRFKSSCSCFSPSVTKNKGLYVLQVSLR
uniref:Uncharacterized protein n=1 Tax=Arundo donax TaxID=35708 RepID=A0A0A9B326_ARUDO